MLEICVWNWADYNDGISSWQWFELPRDLEKLLFFYNKYYDQEPFVCDSFHSFINEYSSIEKIMNLSVMDSEELVDLSEVARTIYPMQELDNFLNCYSPTEIIRATKYGDFNLQDEYFELDEIDHLNSYTESEYFEIIDEALNEACDDFLNTQSVAI